MRNSLAVFLLFLLPLAAVADDGEATAVVPTTAPITANNVVDNAADTAAKKTDTAAVTPPQSLSAPRLGSGIPQTNPFTLVLGLAVIVALIFATAWLIRRVGGVNPGATSALKILAGLSVGPREKIVLIEAGDKQILVGVANGSVSHLQTFDTPIVNRSTPTATDFSHRLRSLLYPTTNNNSEKPS